MIVCSCWHKVISNIIWKTTFSAQIDWPLPKMIWNRSPSFTTLIFKILNIHHLEQDCQNHQGFPTSPCSLTLSQKCNRSWRKYFDRISSAECMEGSINILTLTYLLKLSVFLIVNFFTCLPPFAGRQLERVGLYGLLSFNVTDIFEGLRQHFLVLHYHLLVFRLPYQDDIDMKITSILFWHIKNQVAMIDAFADEKI